MGMVGTVGLVEWLADLARLQVQLNGCPDWFGLASHECHFVKLHTYFQTRIHVDPGGQLSSVSLDMVMDQPAVLPGNACRQRLAVCKHFIRGGDSNQVPQSTQTLGRHGHFC